MNDVNDTITHAKGALAEGLTAELATLNGHIATAEAQINDLYALKYDLVRQIHQITQQAMDEALGPVHLRSQSEWRARNIALCRLFLTTTMNVKEIAGHFGISGTTVRLVLFKFGIPSKRHHAPRPEWERQQGFGKRRDQLPPDLITMIEAMKGGGELPTQSLASDTPACGQSPPPATAPHSR